ncbi:hypothetical protein [Rufibacter quisquiliarum]|uniref:Lipoprotein n=1 Tax=Rufibacter quisquiliarum TaxID=1549639 RepID=A0A839GM33_9BACT|nr:hypothetical protein [Rufibacter quisquiliarum]MBA9079902.1 hypothetical protein [Rufibacter quisquiliarum]
MKNNYLLIFLIVSLLGSLQSCLPYANNKFDKLSFSKIQQDSLEHYDSTFKEILYSLSSKTGDPIYEMGISFNEDSTFFLSNCLDGVYYIPLEKCKVNAHLTDSQRKELYRFTRWGLLNGITGGGHHQTLQQIMYLLKVDYREYEDARWVGVNVDTIGISRTVMQVLDHDGKIMLLKSM